MLESNLESGNINIQEDFLNDRINEINTQKKLKVLNPNDNTLSFNFRKFDKKTLIPTVVILLIIGVYLSIENETLACLYVVLILIFIWLISIMFSKRNIVFIKDQEKNILIAKIYNNFGCRKKKKIFHYLNSIEFEMKVIPKQKDTFYRLFVCNNLSRLSPTDLEKDNIKIKPLDLYYYFDDLEPSGRKNDIISELNEFTNSSNDFDSPLFFNASQYISRNEVNYPNEVFNNQSQIMLSKIMRFSNYFFTFHIREPNEKFKKNKLRSYVISIIIITNLFLLGGMAAITSLVLKIENALLSVILSYGAPIFFDVILFIIKICLDYRIKRIDCIYSSDFYKIFIGTTTINEKCYKNTFEYQLDEINRFYARENGRKTFLSMTVSNNNIDI